MLHLRRHHRFPSGTMVKRVPIVDEITKILTHLINLSFSTGTSPKALRRSLATPLFKKGEKDDVNICRPITLIPILSKIFEKEHVP